MLALLLVVLIAVSHLIAAPALAQSLNIDFGSGGTQPSSAYGAAGPVGVWNEIGVLPQFQRAPLVGLSGAPVAAQIYMFGGTALHVADDPATSGDHASLMDDMLWGYNDPVDVCVWVENLELGDYQVIIYALTPNNPLLSHRVRVDYATPGPVTIGGAWPGVHQQAVTFEAFNVSVTNGRIGLHSGLYAGYIQSGINAIQIIRASTSRVDLPDPSLTSVTRVWPNPAAGPQRIELTVPAGGPTGDSDALTLHDASGRLVWRRSLDGLAPGLMILDWDGLGTDGRRLPSGVFFLRVESRPQVVHKVLRLR